MSNTAGHSDAGVTSFVLGRNQDGNMEVVTFEDGQEYDLSPTLIEGYTANNTTFPYPAS